MSPQQNVINPKKPLAWPCSKWPPADMGIQVLGGLRVLRVSEQKASYTWFLKFLEEEPAGGAAFKESSEAGGSATSALLTLEARYIFVVGGCLCTVGCIAASPVSIPLPKMSPVIDKCFPGEVGREGQFQLRTTVLRSKGPGSKGIIKEVSMCEVGQQVMVGKVRV